VIFQLIPEDKLQASVAKVEELARPPEDDYYPELLKRVESRRDIIPCPSLLNLGVQLSLHPASDVLSFRFCSCVYNRGSFHELLEGFLVSNCYDWHQHDVNVPSHH